MFLLSIMTRLPRIPLLDRTAEFFYTTLPYIGVRSWVVCALFEVRNGKLDRSTTGVSEIRMERLDSGGYRLFPLKQFFSSHPLSLVGHGYAVETWRDAASFVHEYCRGQDYRVHLGQAYSQLPANELETCVVQSAGEPLKRAFDVHLRCLNGLLRSCRFDKLAPSPWAYYSAKDGTGTRDPHK